MNDTHAGSRERPGRSEASTQAVTARQSAPLPRPLLIYGAYGKTDSLVAKAALRNGHEVLLAGSDRNRLDRLSAETGVVSVQATLDAPTALRQLIRQAACVIHVAGPFAATFRPMLELAPRRAFLMSI